MHFYEFNIGDYAKKTQHLTNEEDLAYRRLLDMYYDTEKPPLSDGLATLSRRLRVDEQSLKNVLDEFFPGGKNKHCEEKIAAYYEYIAKQSANGKRGGRPKRTQAKPTDNPPQSQNNPVLSQPLPTKPLPTTQEPLPTTQEPIDSKPPKVKTLTPGKPARPEKTGESELQAVCKATWHAYRIAYANRYAVEPLRNAQINAKIKAFCQRVPAHEAPSLAAWYVSHGAQRYVAGGHVVGLLLMDAEKLRTEWATNTKITSLAARQSDRTSGMGEIWREIIEEERLKDEQKIG